MHWLNVNRIARCLHYKHVRLTTTAPSFPWGMLGIDFTWTTSCTDNHYHATTASCHSAGVSVSFLRPRPAFLKSAQSVRTRDREKTRSTRRNYSSHEQVQPPQSLEIWTHARWSSLLWWQELHLYILESLWCGHMSTSTTTDHFNAHQSYQHCGV